MMKRSMQAMVYLAALIMLCSFAAAEEKVNAMVDVEKIDALDADFAMGMDISSLLSQLESGVKYHDFEGNELDTPEKFCSFIRSCGVTHVRMRVWNNPFDAQGNGYGGGNCDVNAAVRMAEACAESGLALMVDFHYSDFWADPNKQMVPKAWQQMTLDEKEGALYRFTCDALERIVHTGVQLDYVQVGNETNNAICGETGAAQMCRLFNAGAKAVRETAPGAKVVIHLTNPEKKDMLPGWARRLMIYEVDYDVMGVSYYPFWHGSLDNLAKQIQLVQAVDGKEVLIAESSYPYTLRETDGTGNTVLKGNNDTGDDLLHPFSVQGQASFLRGLIDTVNAAGGKGVFYWESAWTTVGDITGLEGADYDVQKASNANLWEKYGSGWASSYAAEYDPADAGAWYGGSAVDNQAMFDAKGQPLDSINVWKYVYTGAKTAAVSIDGLQDVSISAEEGDRAELPEYVLVQYNKGDVRERVIWRQESDYTQPGVYEIKGEVQLSKEVSCGEYAGMTSVPVLCTLTVKPGNFIHDALDAGFEKGDHFVIGGQGISAIPAWDDPKEGECSMHWYLTQSAQGYAKYTVPITLQAGSYTFEAAAQGMAGDQVYVSILNQQDEVLFAGEAATMAGWVNWQTPKVEFTLENETAVYLRIDVNMQKGGWGTVDCLRLSGN